MSMRARGCSRFLAGLLFCAAAYLPAPGASAIAQPHADSAFALVITAGGGLSRYVTAINTPAGVRASIRRSGAAFTLRALWYPDHLLRVGIETGWVRFFSYTLHGAADGNLYLSAAPLLLVFSMPLNDRMNAYLGVGGYFVSSKLDFGSVVRTTEFSQGWMLGASYHLPLGEDTGIAAEAKWYNASQFEDGSFSLQATFVWRALEW